MRCISVSVFVHRYSVLTHVSFHNGECAIRYTCNGLDAFSCVLERLNDSQALRDFVELRVATPMAQPFNTFPYPAFATIVLQVDWHENDTIDGLRVTELRSALGDGACDLTHAFAKLPEKTAFQVLKNLANFIASKAGAEFVDSINTLRSAFGAKVCKD